jgi:hypothetical protein
MSHTYGRREMHTFIVLIPDEKRDQFRDRGMCGY